MDLRRIIIISFSLLPVYRFSSFLFRMTSSATKIATIARSRGRFCWRKCMRGAVMEGSVGPVDWLSSEAEVERVKEEGAREDEEEGGEGMKSSGEDASAKFSDPLPSSPSSVPLLDSSSAAPAVVAVFSLDANKPVAILVAMSLSLSCSMHE
jgi:hypothetical protein